MNLYRWRMYDDMLPNDEDSPQSNGEIISVGIGFVAVLVPVAEILNTLKRMHDLTGVADLIDASNSVWALLDIQKDRRMAESLAMIRSILKASKTNNVKPPIDLFKEYARFVAAANKVNDFPGNSPEP